MAAMIDHHSGFRNALGQFAAELPRLKTPDRMRLVDQLRRLAVASGLHSAAEVVGGLADAMKRDEGSGLLGPWLFAIDQAVSCGPAYQDAAQLLIATVEVRYAH